MSRMQAIHSTPTVESKNRGNTGQDGTSRKIDEVVSTAAHAANLTDVDAELRLMLPRIRIDAFVESDHLALIVGSVAEDRRAVRAEVGIHRGGFKDAIKLYGDQPPANLILIEDQGSTEELEGNIELLANCCPASSRLLVMGTRNDIAFYRRLTRMGVSDYLVQPIRPLDLLGSILSIFGDADQTELGTVLAFVGARGGSGASTVAHNVAATLSRKSEASTLLIDADIFGTAALQFDFATPQGFFEAVKEGEALNCEMLDRLVHWRDKRIGGLAAPNRPDHSPVPDPGSLRHLIDQARRLAQFVVLDLPHGWSPWIAEALASSDRIGLVTTPDLPSLRNSRALLDMIQKLRTNDSPPDIILNRVPTRGHPPVSAADYARILDRPMAAAIPFDAAAPMAEMSGRVLIEDAPGSPAAKAIGALVTRMIGCGETSGRRVASKSMWGRILKGERK